MRRSDHAVSNGLIDEPEALLLKLGGAGRFLFKLLVVLSGRWQLLHALRLLCEGGDAV